MEAKINQLAPVEDFDKAYIIAQYAHEQGFRGTTFPELLSWLQTRLDLTGTDLIDPTPSGTEASPAVIPPGPEGKKGKFEPSPGFYQGFPEITGDRRWYFYWDGSSWSLVDMGELPQTDVSGFVKKTEMVDEYAVVWEQGGISETTGEDYPSDWAAHNRRVRTQGFIQSTGAIHIESNKGELINLYLYDENGVFISQTGFLDTPVKSTHSGLFKVAVRNSDDTVFTVEDNTAIAYKHEVYLKIENIDSELSDYAQKSELIVEYQPVWEQGGINAANGENNPPSWGAHSRRIRTNDFIKSTSTLSIEAKKGELVNVFYYDEEKNFLSQTGFLATPITETFSGYFKVSVRNADDTDFAPADNTVTMQGGNVYVANAELPGVLDNYAKKSDLKAFYNPVWEQGSIYETDGTNYPPNLSNHTRRVRTANLMECHGDDILIDSLDGQTVNLYYYDFQGNFIESTGFRSTPITANHNGLFRVVVRKSDPNAVFTVEENTVTLDGRERYVLREELNIDTVFKKFTPPTFSHAPFGDTLGYDVFQKEDLFEQIISEYPATVTKELIGQSYSELYDVNAYTLTPEKHTCTIAITCHVHGNEKFHPTGFFALLKLLSETNLEHEFMLWLRNNVRWIIVPFVSPEAYMRNIRNTNNINLNRNMDYDWVETEHGNKGDAPMSAVENQNIESFFMPLRHEIDFHLDCHDIPLQPGISYWVWQNTDFVWLKEQDFVETYLVNLNETNKMPNPYGAAGGSYTQYFTEVLGIPSITPEHCTVWWESLGMPIGAQIAKATEQTAAFLCMFANLHQQFKGYPFYKKLVERSFLSEEFGIGTWSKTQLQEACATVDGWIETDEYDGIMSYTWAPSSYTKTILVYAGITTDNRSSSLTVKQVMQELARSNESLPIYLQLLKNSRIVIVPSLNENPDFAPEDDLESLVQGFQSRYSADYTLVVRGVSPTDEIKPIQVRSGDVQNLTRWSREHIADISSGRQGIENFITGRYAVITLNNHISEAHRYAHGVVKWVKAVVNDVASFNKE